MSYEIQQFQIDFDQITDKNFNQPFILVGSDIARQEYTYGQISQLVTRCINLLTRLEIKPDDIIVSILPNSLEAAIIFLACLKGGYNYFPIPCTFSDNEIKNYLKNIPSKLCFISSQYKREKTQEADFCSQNVVIDVNREFSWLSPSCVSTPRQNNSSRLYLATSGTTGKPKIIVIDGNRLWSSGRAFLHFHGLQNSKMRFWNYLPMSYLGGLFNLLLIPLASEGSLLVDETFNGSMILRFWQTIQNYEINALWLVPSIAKSLLSISGRIPEDKLIKFREKLSHCFIGTAPIDLKTKDRLEHILGMPCLENFALSETTFFSTETNENIKYRTESSVGEILPYVNVKIKPYHNNNEISEIYVKSPFMFLGYLNEMGMLENPLDADGYLSTGDLGKIDPESNQLIIQGRIKDIVKKGGYLIALAELEQLAMQHSSVQEATAVKIPHEYYGESILLCLIPKEETSFLIDEFTKWYHENLAKYKWPEKIVTLTCFPKTPSGKIVKSQLEGMILCH